MECRIKQNVEVETQYLKTKAQGMVLTEDRKPQERKGRMHRQIPERMPAETHREKLKLKKKSRGSVNPGTASVYRYAIGSQDKRRGKIWRSLS